MLTTNHHQSRSSSLASAPADERRTHHSNPPQETAATPHGANEPQTIAAEAEVILRGNAYLALTNLSCTYQDGILTLRGCLPTYYLWRLAQDTVIQELALNDRAIPPLCEVKVVNEIQVVSGTRRHL